MTAKMIISWTALASLATGAAAACPLRMPFTPRDAGTATVIRLVPQDEAMTMLTRTQGTVGAPIDAAYINNQRVIVQRPDGSKVGALLPYGMTVNVGDQVTLQGSYRNRRPLCTYVPVLVTRRLVAE